jgi:dephospho-CoA kinase
MNPPRFRLIGLTGPNAAGKGEAAAFFVSRGYAYRSLSDIIRADLAAAGLPPDRDHLIARGNELRREGGPDILARRLLEEVSGPTVIDSIRNPAEIERFRRESGFRLLAVEAPASLRFERAVRRGRNESVSTLEEFVRKEAQEMSADPSAQQIHRCFEMADAVVSNDGDLEEFHRRLEAFL